MTNKSKILKASLGYTIGNVLLHCMGIVTLPIFTRLMTTEEYGSYGVFMSFASILLSLVSCALHTSIRSAKIEFGEKINDYTSSVTLVYFFNLIILLILAILLPSFACEKIGLNNFQLILLSIYTFGTSIMNLYNTWLSIEYSVSKFIKLSILNTIVSLVLSLLLMYTAFNENRLLGRLLSITIAVSLVSTIALISLFKKSRPKYNGIYLKFGLRYSFPLIAHGVAQTLLSQFDRIMINSIVGQSEAGIYNFAGSIKNLLNVISNSLNTVWSTWFFEEMSKDNKEKVKRRASEYCLFVLLLGVCALCVAPEVVKLLGAEIFWDARYLAPPMVLDSYVMFLYAIIVQTEYYTKKTHFVLIGTAISAIINIITNIIFINKYGYVAAAYTTLFAYICYYVFHIYISKKAIGFCVVGVFQHLTQGIFIVICAIICLFCIDIWYIRWGLMIVLSVGIGLILFRMISKDGDVSFKSIKEKILHKS